jgi:DNA-binding response OmpR family regulator
MNELFLNNLITWTEDRPKKVQLASLVKSMNVVVIDINDQNSTQRIEWLRNSEIEFQLIELDPFEFAEFSFDFQKFSIVVISSDIMKRANVFIKRFSHKLRYNTKVNISSNTNPKDRAAILNAGFDTIVDISSDIDIEVMARIIAIQRRYGLTQQAVVEEVAATDTLASLTYMAQLNRRHTIIIETMIAEKNGIVKTEELKRILSLNHEPISENQVKVLVSQTRRRLRPGVRIVSLRKVGGVGGAYQLLT